METNFTKIPHIPAIILTGSCIADRVSLVLIIFLQQETRSFLL